MTETGPIEFFLVEENEADIMAFRRAWKSAGGGHPLQVVPGGKSCLELLEDRNRKRTEGRETPPAVVILNDRMSTMGGVETLKSIRATDDFTHVPVVMLMASSETYRELKAYRLGANAYIVKPMEFDRLVEIIQIVVGFWELAELPT
mgnify:CR=1 FL=1